MTTEELPAREPVQATYSIDVTFRGTDGVEVPTISEIEEAIENTLVNLGGAGSVAVRASARRTDR
jgi:hypothetical protein